MFNRGYRSTFYLHMNIAATMVTLQFPIPSTVCKQVSKKSPILRGLFCGRERFNKKSREIRDFICLNNGEF